MWDLGPAIGEPRGRVRAEGWRYKKQLGCSQVPELRIRWQRIPRGEVQWGPCLAVSSGTDAGQLQLAAAPHISGQGLK